jgi:hypothetical protein
MEIMEIIRPWDDIVESYFKIRRNEIRRFQRSVVDSHSDLASVRDKNTPMYRRIRRTGLNCGGSSFHEVYGITFPTQMP